jgi:SulP family sulfate permease
MIATPVGALFTGSVFMNVSTTGALSVAAGDALVNYSGDQKTTALITLALLIGVFQLAAGLLRLGSLIRFVSQSVMTGFITGIALLIIFGAIPDVTGYTSPFNSEFLKLADTILNLNQFEPVTFVLGILTIVLIVGLGFTPARKFSMVLALVVVTLLGMGITAVLGETVFVTVGAITTIPRSLPRPALPDLFMIPALALPALAISIIGLVQGAGVSQSYPNPDGKFPDVSRDFTGQGIANIATSFFTAIPGGGSMSGTAVTVNAGARSRWANILAGFFVILIVLLFAGAVKLIPMSALAGLLIVVGFQNLQPQQILIVWQTGRVAQTAMILTLLATLALPLQYAIVIGVAISIMMHVFRSSNQVRLVEILPVEGGYPIEQPAPLKLADHEVTLLYAYGSLFFAAAATVEKSLPNADDAKEAVVILILRGQPEVGSTFIGVLRRYATTLQANGGRLVLTGVNPRLRYQLERTGTLAFIGEENVFMEQAQMGVAMNEALATAHTWLETVKPQGTDEYDK